MTRATLTLGSLLDNFDSRRVPVKSSDRRAGPFPYYGASGVVDYVDDYLFDGEYLLVAEDGENLRTRNTPIAFLADDKFWVNNHAHVVRGNHLASTRFLSYLLAGTDVSPYITGSAQPKLSRAGLDAVQVCVPGLPEQQAIAEVLGALDDKIAANERLAECAFRLAGTVYRATASGVAEHAPVGRVARVVLGGTPARANASYWSDGTIPWLQSGAANADRIVAPSALITIDALRESAAKLMPVGATVVAITGATLGQVARLEIEASGNQSLVGAWCADGADSAWLHFAIRDAVPELLTHATGAAQQHVSKGAVSGLTVVWPAESLRRVTGYRLQTLLTHAASADFESSSVRAVRDMLLPELMSGRLRVKDAEQAIEEVL